MQNEKAADSNLQAANVAKKATDETIDRRTVAGRLGKFVAYTAPAMIALITAKDACGYD